MENKVDVKINVSYNKKTKLIELEDKKSTIQYFQQFEIGGMIDSLSGTLTNYENYLDELKPRLALLNEIQLKINDSPEQLKEVTRFVELIENQIKEYMLNVLDLKGRLDKLKKIQKVINKDLLTDTELKK